MTKRQFSRAEIEYLRTLPSIDAVTDSRITYAREFQIDCMRRYLQGEKPTAIFISAGFDAHYEDDMGSLGLVEADYMWVTEQLKAIAAESANRRIVSLLEGGYSLSSLARSVVAHIKTLADL